jgi:hypothetical protein
MSIQWVVKHVPILLVLSLALTQTACDAGLRHVSGIDGLVLEFRTDRSQARANEPIKMQFTVSNRGQRHIIIESTNTPVMDINVEEFGRTPVIPSWSAQNPDQVVHHLEWKPGETKTIELVWTPKQEDIYIGAVRIIYLTGVLVGGPGTVQSAGVMLCASNVCR